MITFNSQVHRHSDSVISDFSVYFLYIVLPDLLLSMLKYPENQSGRLLRLQHGGGLG